MEQRCSHTSTFCAFIRTRRGHIPVYTSHSHVARPNGSAKLRHTLPLNSLADAVQIQRIRWLLPKLAADPRSSAGTRRTELAEHRGAATLSTVQAVTSCRPQHPTQTSCSLTIRRGSSCVYQRRHSSRQFCRRFTIARKLGSGLYH